MEQSFNNSGESLEADNIFYQAEKLRDKCLYQESLRLFRKALQGYRKIHDKEGISGCMLSLGDIYRMIGNFDLAANGYREAINLANESNPVKVADAEVGLGLSLRALGNWKEALKFIRKSKRTYQDKYDTQGLAFTLWAEAGTLRVKGDIKGAIGCYKESRKIFTSLKDTPGIGYCLCGLGGASRIAGLFKTSLQYYIAANRLFSAMKDTFGTAYSYCGIANAYRMLKDYENAFIHFSKATRLYKKIGDRVSYAYTLWGLSSTYKMIADYKKAYDYLIMALNLFKKTKDPRGLIYCESGLGEIALIKGKKAIAMRYISAA